MNKTYRDHIDDILDAIQKIEEFSLGFTFDKFSIDYKTIYAVTRALEIIGEAANKFPPEIKAKYPSIPWSEMYGMRNKLIHDYSGVDVTVIWKTIKKDIPVLKTAIQQLADNEE